MNSRFAVHSFVILACRPIFALLNNTKYQLDQSEIRTIPFVCTSDSLYCCCCSFGCSLPIPFVFWYNRKGIEHLIWKREKNQANNGKPNWQQWNVFGIWWAYAVEWFIRCVTVNKRADKWTNERTHGQKTEMPNWAIVNTSMEWRTINRKPGWILIIFRQAIDRHLWTSVSAMILLIGDGRIKNKIKEN